MYMDKCGAVLVLAAFAAVVELGLPINLVGGVGFVENMISDKAYRNGDLLVSK
jgi:leucyl aminopeptidase